MSTHYYIDDLGHLINRGPYLTLARPRSATSWLRAQVDAGQECSAALRDYPQLQIEPLEFHYACLQSLGALDDLLLRDLTSTMQNWRGVVWGAFLAALEPRPSFAAILEQARPSPHNQWLVDIALAAAKARPVDPELRELAALIDEFAAPLRVAQRPRTLLRHSPTPEQAAQLERERELVRQAYAEGGVEAAKATIAGTLWTYYLPPYRRWIRMHKS